MKRFTPLLFITALLAAVILSTLFIEASTTSKTNSASPLTRAQKEKTKIKLEKVIKLTGGWIELRKVLSDGKYLYACSSAATLSKFDIANEKHIKTVYVEGGIDTSIACTYSNGYLYTLGRRADDRELPAVLWRYNASDMTVAGPPLDIPGEKVRAWDMTSNDDYLFLPILSEPGRVLRIRLNPFEHDLTITFAGEENFASSITFDDSREHIFVGLHNPALIKKISASTLEEIDTVELNNTQDNGYVRLDQDGKFIYCAVSHGYAAVVKVDMETMELVAWSQAGNRNQGNGVVVSDRGSGLLYLGDIDMGFSWLKVDATAGEDGEDMENMGVLIKYEQEPANRIKHAIVVNDTLWVANGRGKLLKFSGIRDGGPPARTFNNKYSGEPFDVTKLDLEEGDEDEDQASTKEKEIEKEGENGKKKADGGEKANSDL